VENNHDKILTEKIIQSTFSNKINLYQIAEKIKKEEYKDLNIGIYLETTLFEPETSPFLKKQILLKRKKELKFCKNFDRKLEFKKELDSEKMDVMDIESDEQVKVDEKLKEIDTKNPNDHILNECAASSKIKPIKPYSLTITQEKESVEENLILNHDENKSETQIKSFNKNSSVNFTENSNNRSKTSNEREIDAQGKNDEYSNDRGKVPFKEDYNSKSLSLNEHKNHSQASNLSINQNEKINKNSANSLVIHESDEDLSLSSRGDKYFQENFPLNSKKIKNSPSVDNNSMINNHNSSNQDGEERPKINKKQISKSKILCTGNSASNSNGRVKTYRKILGQKRNMNNDRDITYQNLSSINKQKNADEDDEERNMKNVKSNSSDNKNSSNSESVDAPNEEEVQYSPEDEFIMQQEASELDEYLFRIDLLTTEKLNKFSYFLNKCDEQQSLIDTINITDKNSTMLGNSNINGLKDKQNNKELDSDSSKDINHLGDNEDKYFQSSIYQYAFNKSNSDALIIYLFPEKESKLLILNNYVSKTHLTSYFDNQLNSVYIPIEFIFANKARDLYGPKGNPKFKLRLDDDIDEIMDNVIRYFNFNLVHFSLDKFFLMDEITSNILFYNERRELISLETLLSNLNKEYFVIRRTINLEQIPSNSNNYNFLASLVNKFPLLQFMDSKDALYKLTFQMSFIKLKNLGDFLVKDLILYNIDNNPIIKIYFAFPHELYECNDYLKYMNDHVLKVFYSDIYTENGDEAIDRRNSLNNSIIERKNSDEMIIESHPNSTQNNYFISEKDNKKINENIQISDKNSNQNNEGKIGSFNETKDNNLIVLNADENNENLAVEKILNNSNSDKRISIKLENFKFMLQHHKRLFAYDIFINNEDELFKYEKNELNISYRIQPLRNDDLNLLKQNEKIFVAFCRRDSSAFCDPIIISLPNETRIGEMKREIFNKLKKIKATQTIEYSKIKYYIYSLIDYKPHKNNLLINSKDEEKICQFFKKGARNVLVELLQMEGDTSGKELNMMG
jgi:hypothetical protein